MHKIHGNYQWSINPLELRSHSQDNTHVRYIGCKNDKNETTFATQQSHPPNTPKLSGKNKEPKKHHNK